MLKAHSLFNIIYIIRTNRWRESKEVTAPASVFPCSILGRDGPNPWPDGLLPPIATNVTFRPMAV